MPRAPAFSGSATAVRGGVFARHAARIAALDGETYPFHVGDLWKDPPPGARWGEVDARAFPAIHRYADPRGLPPLLRALAAAECVDEAHVIVTAGATGALAALAAATLDPGDEVLIPAPYWPLIPGVVQTARGVPVECPGFESGPVPGPGWAAAVGPRTAALYLNQPHNPSGRVLGAEALAAVAAFARAHDLWIWADEVYAPFAWGRAFLPMRAFAPERTFTALSFSKAWAMAGNRCGALIVPPVEAAMDRVRACGVHTVYACATGVQLAALRALEGGAAWRAETVVEVEAITREAAAILGVPAPEGGTFLFIDVSAHLDARGLDGFLSDALDRNVIVAPGAACGRDYGAHIRVCTSAVQPERSRRGLARLAGLLGR